MKQINLYKDDFEDISLLEDFMDDFAPETGAKQSNVVIKQIDTDDFNPEDYKFKFSLYIQRQGLAAGLNHKHIKMETKLRSFENMVNRVLLPYIEGMRYMDDIYVGWAMSPNNYNKVWPVEQTYEFFSDEEELRSQLLMLVIYFNPYENLRLRHILYILQELYLVKTIMDKFRGLVSASNYYLLNNQISYEFDGTMDKCIKDKYFSQKKDEKLLRHFVSLFSKSKQIQAEFKEMFNRADSDFMHTGCERYEFVRLIDPYSDFDSGKIVLEEVPNQYKYRQPLIMRILRNATITIAVYHYTQPDVIFIVEGTLVMKGIFDKNDSWHNNTKYELNRLKEDEEHNEVVLLPDFRCCPSSKDCTTINVHHRHIKKLIVRCLDVYIENEEHLSKIFDFDNAENV